MSWLSRRLAAVFGGAKDSSEKVPEPAASRADEHMLQDANEDLPPTAAIANTAHDVHREEGPPAGGANRALGSAFNSGGMSQFEIEAAASLPSDMPVAADRPENVDAGVDQMLEEPVALGAKRKREEDNSGAVSPGTVQKKKKSLEARRAEIRAEVEEMAESKIKSELASKGFSTEQTLLFVDLVELLVETRLDPEAEEEVQEAREPSSSAASQSNGEHDQQQGESAATGSSAATAPCSRARVRPLSHCRVRPLSQHRA